MVGPRKHQKVKPLARHSVFPINQFPREILAEIFWNCLPETDVKGPDVQMTNRKRVAPLLVSSICSSWRELALASPKLWTTLGIILGNPDTNPSATAIQVVNTWLERSGTLPLKLYLAKLSYDAPPMSNAHPTLSQSILFAFYLHSSRWQDVNLFLYGIRSLQLPRLDTPILRSFSLSGPWQGASNLPFSNSSRLTELSWPSPINVSEYPQIPWSQLSNLKIGHGMSLFSVSEMIHLCSQLEEFWVGCSGRDEVANLPREPKVENGRLRKLELYFYKDVSLLLHSLTLPALEQFICYTQNNEVDMQIPNLHFESLWDFLTRSHCKLKKLMLGDCKFSANELLECLEHEASETIQELTIAEWPKLTDDVLLRLTRPPSPTASAPRILLPKLTHLTLEYCLDTSPGILGAMVSSRYYPKTSKVKELEVLALSLRNLDSEDETTIKDLAADGLDTRIFHESAHSS